MKNIRPSAGIVLALALLAAAPAHAVNGECHATGQFSANVDNEWTEEQNFIGSTQQLPSPLAGNAYQIECSCNPGTQVALSYFVTSALTQRGQLSGYYHLNDNLDIKTEVNDIPDTTGPVTPLNVRPTRELLAYKAGNEHGSVCRDDPPELRAAPSTVGSHTTLTLYVTKPFLGELIIPDTHVASIQAAWNTTVGAPPFSVLKDIAELHIQGRIIIPSNCKINQGDTIQVDLGSINASRFTTKDHPPEGYNPVQFEIAYDCGDTSASKNDLSMRIDTPDRFSQYVLVARRRPDNVPDIGITMVNLTNGNNISIPVYNGQIDIDPSGRGSTLMEAYPINLVGGALEPGQFHGSATITVEVR